MMHPGILIFYRIPESNIIDDHYPFTGFIKNKPDLINTGRIQHGIFFNKILQREKEGLKNNL